MSKVFLSFLGTNDYIPCNYYLDEDNYVANVNFVQEAMVKLFYNKFNKLDKVIIFLTRKAREINWSPQKGKLGLKECLKNLNLSFDLIDIDIPEGKSSDEIWKIFNIVYNSINERDEIIFDITHGFRSLPLLGIVLLNYARFLKNISVLGIYYGAFEVLGTRIEIENIPIEKRNAPIFDLTSFDLLQRWSIAAENFVNYGKTDKIFELVKNKIEPILKNSKGHDIRARTEKNLINNLRNVSNILHTVRGKLIFEGNVFIELKDLIQNIYYEDNSMIAPLNPLKEKILSKVLPFSNNDVFNGFRGVKWCIDHDLIQQGITLLQETIVTYILEKSNFDWQELEYREAVSRAIKAINIKKEDDDINKKEKLFVAIIKNDELLLRLSKYYEKLRNPRNDINHGGFLRKYREPEKFKKILENIFKEIVSVITGII